MTNLPLNLVSAACTLALSSSATAQVPDHDSWFLPTQDHTAKLYVEELGPPSADPVVVLHGGWGAEHSYLVPVVSSLAAKGVHFVLYDQRGSLLSATRSYKNLSVGQQVGDLELLRRTLGVEKLRILAHSMGTFLALEYLSAHPDHVSSLILTGAIPARTANGAAGFWKESTAYAMNLQRRPEVMRQI